MSSITEIILDDTATLTAADWDFDPAMGAGPDECEAPADFDSASFSFDPWVA